MKNKTQTYLKAAGARSSTWNMRSPPVTSSMTKKRLASVYTRSKDTTGIVSLCSHAWWRCPSDCTMWPQSTFPGHGRRQYSWATNKMKSYFQLSQINHNKVVKYLGTITRLFVATAIDAEITQTHKYHRDWS